MYDDQVKYLGVGETIDYSIDFTEWLNTGETLSSIISLVSNPTGLTISDQSISGALVLFTLSGATACGNYEIICTVQTSTDEILIPKVKLRVR